MHSQKENNQRYDKTSCTKKANRFLSITIQASNGFIHNRIHELCPSKWTTLITWL